MPELPEVETIVRTLRPVLIEKQIQGVDLRWDRTLATPTPRVFRKKIMNQVILDVTRRAKFIRLVLSSSNLILHLRMSGDLLVVLGGYQPARHDRMLLSLSGDMTLVFSDTRKFGRVWLVDDPAPVFNKLGPEPLSDEFTASVLQSALHKRHRQIKPLLLDQTFVSGLGNIYTDEALHLAKIHPLTFSDNLSPRKNIDLWHAIREVLEDGIRHNGASIDWVYRGGNYQDRFRVYGRTGEACGVCGTKIKRMVVGQRGTHYCPKCQKLKE
jgi:formamidopyrimidine-DNA glycosylase